MDDKEKQKKDKELERLLEGMRGKGIDIWTVKDDPSRVLTERVTTGIDSVDKALGGGLPKGFITTIWGPYNCGKTWFCMEVAKRVVAEGGRVLYIDLEGMGKALDTISKIIGLDPSEMIVLNAPDYGDKIVDVVEDLLLDKKTKKPRNLIDLVIVDSISNIVPKSNLDAVDKDGSAKVTKIGSHAKLMTDWLARYYGRGVCEGNQIVLLISQVRADFNVSAGSKNTGPSYQMSGGNAILHNSKIIMKFGKRPTWVEVKEDPKAKAIKTLIGHTVLINVEKNSTTGLQGIRAEYSVKYGVGIDDAEALSAKAQLPEWGYIFSHKRGWFTIICPGLGDVVVQGKANIANVIKSRVEIADSLRKSLGGQKPLEPAKPTGIPYEVEIEEEDEEE